MRESLRTAFAAVLAVALVSTAGLAPVGTATAQEIGDQPKNCSAVDKYIVAATWTLGAGFTDCEFGTDAEKLRESDAAETRVNVYQTAANTRANSQNTQDGFNNYAQDGVEVALMDGKNEFIKSVDNGSSQTAANSSGIEAIQDWAAGRQVRLLDSFSVASEAIAVEIQEVENDSNLNKGFIDPDTGVFDMSSSSGTFGSTANTYQVELANGSTAAVSALASSSDGSDVPYHPLSTESLSITVNSFGDDYSSDQPFLRLSDWKQANQEIVNAKDSAITKFRTFSAATYPSIESGEISPEELIDPYIRSRSYSPNGSYGSFTLATMQQLGYGAPSDLSNVKEMTVAYDGKTRDGVLLSDELPPNGSFEVGTTYNASNISGMQLMSAGGSVEEITDRFTVTEIRGTDGEPTGQQTVDYREIDYQSTNLSEFRETMDQIAETQAQIEARQQSLRNQSAGGGGGLFNFGGLAKSLPFSGASVVAALGAIVVLGLVTRN